MHRLRQAMAVAVIFGLVVPAVYALATGPLV